jgi:hypothetical protein
MDGFMWEVMMDLMVLMQLVIFLMIFFYAVHDELKGFLCYKNRNSSNKVKSEEDFCHIDVLEALFEAMRKIEDAFFNIIIDDMINHNPVLAMIWVLVFWLC